MSYSDLCQVVRKAARVIRWFAMREAITLQAEIAGSCHEIETHPDDEERQRRLVEVTRNSYEFLRQHNTKEAIEMANELDRVLVKIELEGIVE